MKQLDLLPGAQVGNYRLTRLLERGNLADMYLGQQLYLKTEATIKVLHIDARETHLELFLAEMRTFVTIKHAHIARLLEFGLQEQTPFLVLACVSHGTLHSSVPPGTKLSLELACSYTYQIAFALQHAHERGLLHRTLRPEHLLLGEGKHLWVSDFGLRLLVHGSQIGLQEDAHVYTAPENRHGEYVAASDQYALAGLLYEWLVGQHPYRGSHDELPAWQIAGPPPELNTAIPRPVERVLLTALDPHPEQRYTSMGDFAQALEQASGIRIEPALLATPPQFGTRSASEILPGTNLSVRSGGTLLLISEVATDTNLTRKVQTTQYAIPPGFTPTRRNSPRPKRVLLLLVSLLLILALVASTGLIFVHLRSTRTPTMRIPPAGTSSLSPQTLYQHVLATRPLLVDALNNPQNSLWENNQFTSFDTCQFISGVYQVNANLVDNAVCLTKRAGTFTDFAFQADLTIISGNDTQKAAGLVFHSDSNFTQYDDFSIDTLNGRYIVMQVQNGIRRAIKDGYLHIKLAATNRLMVIAQGSRYDFYINGTPITFLDNQAPSVGELGLASLGSTANFTNAEIWKL